MSQFQTLKKRSQFLKATSISCRTSNVIVQCNAQVSELAFGFTASRRVGNAIMRNRAKRRLRSIVLELTRARTLPNCHFVLIAKTSCVECRFSDLQKDVFFGVKQCLEKMSKNSIMENNQRISSSL